ncbi:MAG: hypothetical protein K8H84_05500 [Sulfuricella denitrificans]|nr:hypothetical protein [Sulfuricella denitrificans]
MKKEEMIRRILRHIESDQFKIKRLEMESKLKAELMRLNTQTYSEVEAIYYSLA